METSAAPAKMNQLPTGLSLQNLRMPVAERCAHAKWLAIGVLAAFNSLAQTPPDNALPEALKRYKPTAGECLREASPLPEAPKPVKAESIRPDLTCAIAPSELSGLIKRSDTVMADVRPATAYAAFHIIGAMNLTAAELRTKPFLKTKTVVLIGNGLDERQQFADCARLKASGFKHTKVLRGGLPTWLSSGQTVLGRTPEPIRLGRLEPGELWAETRFDANLVLVTQDRQDLLREWPSATTIPNASLAAVQAAIQQHGKKPLAAVVLVTSEGGNAANLNNLSQAIQPIPLLTYTGSAEAYSHQRAQQQAVWDAQARGPKKPRCGS